MIARFIKSQNDRSDNGQLANLNLSKIAKKNTYRFIAVLFFSEVALLTLSRLINTTGWVFYNIAPFKWDLYLLTVAGAGFFSFLAYFFSRFITFIPQIQVSKWLISIIFLATIISNLASAVFLSEGARYTSGGLTGAAGVVYAISRSLSVMSIIISIKDKYSGNKSVNKILIYSMMMSLFATIDGLAPALSIACFLFIYFQTTGFKNIMFIIIGLMNVLLLLFLGFQSKFTIVPAYLTPEFAIKWSIARMAISSEQLYKYISGGSTLNGKGEYIDLIIRSWENRSALIFQNNPALLKYPRTVSEAMYMDMYNNIGSGSSPGFYLGILFHGAFSVVLLFAAVYIFGQMFYGVRKVFNVVELYALLLITKIIHTNITEYVVFLSPLTLALLTFVLASIIVPQRIDLRVRAADRG